MITWEELGTNLKEAADAAKIEDIHPLEIRAFLSTFVTTIGITALHAARRDRDKECLVLHYPGRGSGSTELIRQDLLALLSAGSGLQQSECHRLLSRIEHLIKSALLLCPEIAMENFGVWKLREDGDGYSLYLDERLRVTIA